MSHRKVTTAEKGKFKEQIQEALYKSIDIRDLLLGDTSGMTPVQIRKAFREHVKTHLFVDGTIKEADSFIFYDVMFPSLSTNIKDCKILMYLICHRSILDDYYREGFYGNRADILEQMVEDVLLNDTDVAYGFGIGRLSLDSVNIYNASRFYGSVLTFSVPNFRWQS